MGEKKGNNDKTKEDQELLDYIQKVLDDPNIEVEVPMSPEDSPLNYPIKDLLANVNEQDQERLFNKIVSWIGDILIRPFESRINIDQQDECCSYHTWNSNTAIKEDFIKKIPKEINTDSIKFETLDDIEAIPISPIPLFNNALQSIIKCILQKPKSFVKQFTLANELYSDTKEEEISSLKLLISEFRTFINSNDYQQLPIPNFFVIKNYDHFEIGDERDALTYSERSLDFKYDVHAYIASKITSDNFTKVLIKVFEYRLNKLNNVEINEFSSIPKAKKNKKSVPIHFKEFFVKPEYEKLILNILNNNELLNKDGSWKGCNNNKAEFVVLYHELIVKEYINKPSSTKIAGELMANYFNFNIDGRSFYNKEMHAFKDTVKHYQLIIPKLDQS
ncbi:MAG: hypothetical protein HRT71_14550 [Flavobacteriales bacterium]|nr:hypothetical protein [Flavobacteriales bacterium]